MIVDYCGILKHLRKALAAFAGTNTEGGGGEIDPTRPEEESLAIFDLLRKSDLSAKDIKRIKKVTVALLRTVKERIRDIDHCQLKSVFSQLMEFNVPPLFLFDAVFVPSPVDH